MFEFYRIVANPDGEEIKKFQYEETPETTALKEKLLKITDEYEEYDVEKIDWYYHTHIEERSFPINLSESVFKGDEFVGCMRNGVFFAVNDMVAVTHQSTGAQVSSSSKFRRRK